MTKSREDWIRWFTATVEIDAYEINDDTTEFRGYVECVEGTTFVRTQYCDRTELFKFYVNNGKGRRMKILSWGVNAVKWSPQISERSIVTISRALVHPANPK
ncbi:uncharacterized protein LOC141528026 [Cotesia typhae]|uniref:uncharacterized protein LOC141528026 n=1 Tax=Cotesia typhae TaxID=2053667 RepID=UPI003D690345